MENYHRLKDRHVRYYAQFVEKNMPDDVTAQVQTPTWLDEDRGQIDSATEWALTVLETYQLEPTELEEKLIYYTYRGYNLLFSLLMTWRAGLVVSALSAQLSETSKDTSTA